MEAHDIVRFDKRVVDTGHWPNWFEQENQLYATVRRDKVQKEFIPVGLRGNERNQRFAFELPKQAVKEVICPFELTQKDSFRQAEVIGFPAYQAYEQARRILRETKWGVGGSLGFELATNMPTIKETSDFDLLLYADTPAELPMEEVRQNQDFFSQCDTQVITPKGGFSLQEYLRNPTKKILVKTTSGPILTDKLW